MVGATGHTWRFHLKSGETIEGYVRKRRRRRYLLLGAELVVNHAERERLTGETVLHEDNIRFRQRVVVT